MMRAGNILFAAVGATAVALLSPVASDATAAPGAFEVELKKKLVQKGLDKRIYQELFKRAMPAGTTLAGVSVQGKLSTLGIAYSIPGSGLPEVPAVGDQQTVENCGYEAVESNVTLGTEVRNSATWSKEETLASSFETSIEVEVGYESPFGLSASAKTGFSYSQSQSTTSGQAKTLEKSQTYSLTKTVYTKPGTVSKAQLVYSEKSASNIAYQARYHCSGKTLVTFAHKRNATPNNEVLAGFAGKCLDVLGESRERGARVTIYDCHGRENQRWTYNAGTKEIKGIAGHCLDVQGKHSGNGTPIIMWSCNGGSNQKWTFAANGEIKGLAGKCLDVARYDSSNSAVTHLWDCKATANQLWATRPRTESGAVAIEKYLAEAERTITVKGVFNGLYSSNASSFRVADQTLPEAYCEKVRDQLGIGQYGATSVSARAVPKVPVSRSLPKPGGAVAMTARSVKDKTPAYVVVRKPTPKELKAEKPLPAKNAVK